MSAAADPRRSRAAIEDGPAIAATFRPARWLPSPHLQTLWGRIGRRGPGIALRREAWGTPDGDEVALDWVDGVEAGPLLLVLHGLEGSSESLYVRGLLELGRRRGWRGVALNFRSCAVPPGAGRGAFRLNRQPRTYHSGETSDLDALVAELVDREPDARIVIVGVSLGGNVLLKWLGERGAAVPEAVRGAATISVPYDLAASSRRLMAGLGPLYVRYFLATLKPKALAFAERHPGVVDVEGVRSARTFWEYDDAAVAPIHGFADAADYYARSSSVDYVDRVRVPTLLVSAADDPFHPAGVLDRVRRRAARPVVCAFTARGGHVGFVAGPPWAPVYWAEEAAVAFLARRLGAAAHA